MEAGREKAEEAVWQPGKRASGTVTNRSGRVSATPRESTPRKANGEMDDVSQHIHTYFGGY